MSADHLRVMQRCCRTTTTAALLFLLSALLFHHCPVDSSNGSTDVKAYRVSRPVFAAAQLRQCAQLQDLGNYGVNLNLFAPKTVYLNGEYFCAESAPAQYRCRCGVATTCKPMLDPWERDIGSCDCCSSWMIGCFVILGVFSAISVFGAVYVVGCQGKWWCDGYATLKTALIPRRGPAVSCPPSRPLPQNLFRGYASADFTNVEAFPEMPVSAVTAPTSPQVNTPGVDDPNHGAVFGSEAEYGEARVRYPLLPPELRHANVAAAGESRAPDFATRAV
ncbi:hypothetical protein, conserved [Leishmania donovani]|uniref:Enriched in surface-labeled proteome protein 11, putative n=1 Tax=Leishmania donovani TaxID=5661 RepID=A0A3S7X7R5_LEIDO|nr:hypothetical protein, conserved [Leishmania donovani]AYU82465.1 Enriched in surface-labeled proteome protein 11, putative [Leishmania donovani]TPP40041.1 hypothetical protein CGC21_25975 [Leishmania donovani]CBZ37607.1 hypothetical protein, conserved [Leishmania donovani]